MGSNQIALGDKHMKVVEYVRKNASITNQKVRELLSISNKTAYQVLETLCKYDVLAKRGGGRNTFYILK